MCKWYSTNIVPTNEKNSPSFICKWYSTNIVCFPYLDNPVLGNGHEFEGRINTPIPNVWYINDTVNTGITILWFGKIP